MVLFLRGPVGPDEHRLIEESARQARIHIATPLFLNPAAICSSANWCSPTDPRRSFLLGFATPGCAGHDWVLVDSMYCGGSHFRDSRHGHRPRWSELDSQSPESSLTPPLRLFRRNGQSENRYSIFVEDDPIANAVPSRPTGQTGVRRQSIEWDCTPRCFEAVPQEMSRKCIRKVLLDASKAPPQHLGIQISAALVCIKGPNPPRPSTSTEADHRGNRTQPVNQKDSKTV